MPDVRDSGIIAVSPRLTTLHHRCHITVPMEAKVFEAAREVTCPLGCGAHWCKQCNRTFELGGIHSCDGQAELDRLLAQHNWKKCPGMCHLFISRLVPIFHTTVACGVPVEKSLSPFLLFDNLWLNCFIAEGCNHITCWCRWYGLQLSGSLPAYLIVFSLHSQFCYVCGGEITRSTNRCEIDRKVQAHYQANCKLFEYPEIL